MLSRLINSSTIICTLHALTAVRSNKCCEGAAFFRAAGSASWLGHRIVFRSPSKGTRYHRGALEVRCLAGELLSAFTPGDS